MCASRSLSLPAARLLLLACGPSLAGPLAAQTVEEPRSSWWQRISPEAELRLRHETVREEPGEDDDRYRYRGRLGFSTDLADAVEFGMRLETGKEDPASANLNFGESLSASDIRIDRAYLGWSVSDGLELVAGRMKNPFVLAGGTPLMWDSDVDPEGIAAKIRSGAFFGRIAGFLLDYRADGAESRLYAAQAGVTFAVAGTSALTAGIGWFDFADVIGNSPLQGDDAQGNSVDIEGRYVNDYDVVELFAEYESAIGEWPVVVFAEWTRNTRVAGADTAYAFGVTFGEAEEPMTAEWSWEWRDTEADALVAILTDSNLGDGRTDSSGHVLKGSYMLTGHVAIGATVILSEYDAFDGTSTDFDRVMLDVIFSF